MEKIQKGSIAFIAMTVLACLIILSACGPEQATSTPVPVASSTPAQAGLGLDATFAPLPTLPVSFATRTSGIPEPVATSTPVAETTSTVEATVQIIADMGFRPKPDGYSFENYAGKKKNGKPVPELTLDDLLKMFGDADVCIKVVNGKCTPRQEALEWLNMINNEIPGGHCEGMAVSSLLLFKGMDDPANYGDSAVSTYDIKMNPKVQSLISYYYFLQYLDPVASEYSLEEQSKPSEVLDKVIASMQDGAPDPVNLGFYGGEPDENGYLSGHSITPYSVEDRGNGVFWIYVYDNNWPNKFDAYMQIDRVNETWSYDLSAQNPDYEPQLWTGDADTQTLAALPISWRTGTLICPWCDDVEGGAVDTSMKAVPGLALVNSTKQTTPDGSTNMQITLQGNGQLLIENSTGQRLGYDGGKLVTEIPGARVMRPRTGKGAMQPVFFVPKGEAYNITLTGQAMQDGAVGNSSISLFGQSMSVTVADIALNKGDLHKLTVSADAQNLGFTAGNSAAKPTFRISTTVKSGPGVVLGKPTSYQFQIGSINLTTGQQLDFSLNKPNGQLDLKALGGTSTTLNYNLDVLRTDTNGTEAFKKLGVSLHANDTHKFNFGGWKINGVSIGVDKGSTGNVDATQPVPTVIPTVTPVP